jgi:putative endonuclease
MRDPRSGEGRTARTGRAGEDAALALYLRRGYRPVARNWRCRIGELDLIVARGETLVFCEVKARSGARFGGGYEAVTRKKRAKVRAVAEAFLLATGLSPSSIRFDVASVHVRGEPRSSRRPAPSGGSTVELFEDAF